MKVGNCKEEGKGPPKSRTTRSLRPLVVLDSVLDSVQASTDDREYRDHEPSERKRARFMSRTAPKGSSLLTVVQTRSHDLIPYVYYCILPCTPVYSIQAIVSHIWPYLCNI